MRETNCIIRWIEVYPVDSIIQQLGPVFVYDRADFSLIVVFNALVLLLLFFGGGRGGGGVGTTINWNASVVPILSY